MFNKKLYDIVMNGIDEELEIVLKENNFNLEELTGALGYAIGENNIKMVQLLLSYGADPNGGIEETNKSPMHTAAEFCNIPIFEILIEHGGDVNLTNNNGLSVLHWVIDAEGDGSQNTGEAMTGELTRFLLEHGANPDTIDDEGDTPLNNALHYNHTEAANLIKKYLDSK